MSKEIFFLEFFESPENWEGNEVSLRGFLYQNSHGEWVLSSQPNLKSCCLEKTPFLVLRGEFPNPPTHALLVQGTLLKNEARWELQSAQLIPEEISYAMPILLGLAAIGGLLLYQLRKRSAS